jgi:hypothetical protein
MILMEYLQVFENRVELNIAQFFLGKVRHRTESMTDLESLQEVRKRFVIQCRAEAGFSARVTSIALFHERHLPGCGLFAECGCRPQRRASSCGSTSHTDKGRDHEQSRSAVIC